MEKWIDIKGFEQYQVSDLGRVKRTKILKPRMSGGGYYVVSLCVDGKAKNHYIHQLVAKSFLDKPNGFVVNHKDGVKANNQLSNLEWVTQSKNMSHSYDIGLRERKSESGYKGVKAINNGFMARICRDNKTIYVGTYDTKEKAYEAYKKAIEDYETTNKR
jgi:hypothetical protein